MTQEMALRRLQRFLTLQALSPLVEPGRERLIAHAVFAAYRDCVTLGVGDKARDVLGRRVPVAVA